MKKLFDAILPGSFIWKTKKGLPVLLISFFLFVINVSGQFTPVTITGFNHDVVAESGTSSLTTTTISLDGVTQSNKVMYTVAFKTTNGFGGGGIPDNGIITDAAGSYQLAPYTGNNVLLLQRGQNGDLNIATPAKFTTIRILCFATEGVSLVNATLFFTDGSSSTAFTNYNLSDWFNATTNLVTSGFGRCTRATPASGADAFPTNPRMYYIEINLSCANQQKNLQKINLANVTTGGNNAPYPNACFFAVSGKSYIQNISSVITPATCAGNNGSAALTVTGNTSPYTYSWNTVPVQTGATATNLVPGNYQATITDVNGCTTVYPVTITLQNTLAITASKTDANCSTNGSITITASGGGGANYEYSINGGNTWQSSNSFNNVPAGTYSVLARTVGALCQTTAQQLIVAFINNLTMNTANPVSICQGASVNSPFVSNATAFSWSPTTGVSNPNIINPVLTPQATTLYTVTATLGTCSVQRTLLINIFAGAIANAGPDATIIAGDTYQLQATGSAGTYLWTPSSGLNSATILAPVANPTTTTTYTLRVTTAQGCFATDDVTITVVPYCVKPMDAFTPNGDGINDRWLITNGNCLISAKAQVFNRYGAKVFESDNYKNDWDGTYKGKPLPDGTYYYVISFNILNGKTELLKGNVTILR
jgi:gliding motility-associated-like protein